MWRFSWKRFPSLREGGAVRPRPATRSTTSGERYVGGGVFQWPSHDAVQRASAHRRGFTPVKRGKTRLAGHEREFNALPLLFGRPGDEGPSGARRAK